MITLRSGVCIAPRYGWLARNASPGATAPPHRAMIDFTTSDMAPSWAGMKSACATRSPSARKTAQLKSSISRMIGL